MCMGEYTYIEEAMREREGNRWADGCRYVSGRMFRKSKEGGEEGLKVTVAAS